MIVIGEFLWMCYIRVGILLIRLLSSVTESLVGVIEIVKASKRIRIPLEKTPPPPIQIH